jgi:uncharacterized membrane protein YcgQ (UPF0703/DUF1980 family)
MKNKTILILLFFVVVFSSRYSSVFGQNTPEEISDKFFKLYNEKGVDPSVDYIMSTNKWLKKDTTRIVSIKMQLKKGAAIMGQYHGYELIDKRNYSESLITYDYMMKYDMQPIKITFFYYKPKDVWQIQTFVMEEIRPQQYDPNKSKKDGDNPKKP